MIRPTLFSLSVLGMAYTAWVHNTLAGVFSGATGVLLYLYLRERETTSGLIYVLACSAHGVTPDAASVKSFNLGDGDDEGV